MNRIFLKKKKKYLAIIEIWQIFIDYNSLD